MKRFFIIGTFLLLLAVLSAASACAATTISSVSVTVTAPAIGAKPSYTAKLGGSTYSLDDESEDDTMENGVFWYDVTEDKFLPESFQVGHEYRVGIFLVPKAGYAFASDAKGTINGVDSFAQVYWNGKLYISHAFPVLSNISSVSVTVTPPAIGAKPSYTAKLGASTYSLANKNSDEIINGVYWYDATEGNFVPTASGSFQAGHQYRVGVFLAPKAGYAFASDTKSTINGVSCTVQKWDDGQLKLSYTFPALSKPISSVSVTVTPPAIGAKPSYTATLGGSTYSLANKNSDEMINGVYWYDATEGNFVPTASGSFQAGHQYRVGVFLAPKAGSAFASDTKGTINGVSCTVQKWDDGQLKLSYTFPAPSKPISSVSVTVTAPAIGAKPSYTATLGGSTYSLANKNSDEMINGVYWYDVNKYNLLPPASGSFRAEHEYEVGVFLAPKAGYAFASDTKGTINGVSCTVQKWDGGQLKLSYTFPALPEFISSVSVTVTPPAAGAYPSYTAALGSSAYYNEGLFDNSYAKNGIYWYDLTEKDVVYLDTDPFKPGHQYRFFIFLDENSGDRFADGVTGTVNGHDGNVTVFSSDIRLSYTFPTLPEDPSAHLSGDVNKDGKVDGRDLLRLARYLAGHLVEIDLANADVNGDVKVDGRDLLRLARFIAGQISSL